MHYAVIDLQLKVLGNVLAIWFQTEEGQKYNSHFFFETIMFILSAVSSKLVEKGYNDFFKNL